MSLRTRLLAAFVVVVLIPIALLAFGLRQEMTRRLSNEYQRRVDTVVAVIGEDLGRESDGIAQRLASLSVAIQNDGRFRLAAVVGLESERDYLLDYAATAMRLTGLSMLQILDADGRVISSGHFRNEHGRLEAALVPALAKVRNGVTLVTVHGAESDFIVLARSEPFRVGARSFTLIGGVTVDGEFLARLARDRDILVSLTYLGGALSSDEATRDDSRDVREDAALGELQLPLMQMRPDASLDLLQARLQVSQPLTSLRALLRSADSWFLFTASGSVVTALFLAVWVSTRISRPLATLAEKTSVLDLDRLDVEFDSGTDEVGRLSRLLGDLATRLRSSTARIREAERRATVGDLARQVTHDIKNGLIPLRNVMRHLDEVQDKNPAALPSVFGERRQTVDSSIAYLETLATSYARLSPPSIRQACDLNALVKNVVRATEGQAQVQVQARLAERLPAVVADPVALRRILENLTANAVDSVDGKTGVVTVATEVVERERDGRSVRLSVTDTGRGMTPEESAQIFNDFYTTKASGTGLGLSIVRRLVLDLQGSLSVESAPGEGTRVVVDIPAGEAERP